VKLDVHSTIIAVVLVALGATPEYAYEVASFTGRWGGRPVDGVADVEDLRELQEHLST
jgi:hypothetical protein